MEKIAELLEKLAVKLGTTVEYLWPLLVQRTKIEWVGGMTASLIVLFIGILFGIRTYYAWTHLITVKDRYGNDEVDLKYGIDYINTGLAILLCLFGLIFVLTYVSSVAAFLSPEATTILDLLSRVK